MQWLCLSGTTLIKSFREAQDKIGSLSCISSGLCLFYLLLSLNNISELSQVIITGP